MIKPLPRAALRKTQAARRLGVCDPIVDRLIREKRLRAFRPTPDCVRILPEDLEAYIEATATIPAKGTIQVFTPQIGGQHNSTMEINPQK
jgi:excisionase family DNA binding protein